MKKFAEKSLAVANKLTLPEVIPLFLKYLLVVFRKKPSPLKKARTSPSPAGKSLASKLAQFARAESKQNNSDEDFVPETVKKGKDFK
jgi:hypothetical protein